MAPKGTLRRGPWEDMIVIFKCLKDCNVEEGWDFMIVLQRTEVDRIIAELDSMQRNS